MFDLTALMSQVMKGTAMNDCNDCNDEALDEILADTEAGVRFPDVRVQLSDMDGNAFAILARCRMAMRRAKVPNYTEEWQRYVDEATTGNYVHLIQTTMRWFDVE